MQSTSRRQSVIQKHLVLAGESARLAVRAARGKLASPGSRRHDWDMLAGCAARAPETPAEVTPPAAVEPSVPGSLIGLTAGEAMSRLGQPVLQVREGPGLKLQWRGSCVLDAYLYLQGNVERITHVDTRLANGNNTPQPACIASLARP
jgi:hypothetical protein